MGEPGEAGDLRTVRALLSHRFGAREPGQGFLGGAITVCELVPLRSIPFRVVCLLGIDDERYPRIEPRPGYDRMALDRRPGDRDARADDRALFLEALLSARDAVVITCTNRSEHTGRAPPPAVPVAELMETVAAMVPQGETAVRVDHPLQPWSPELFAEGRSHDRRMAAAARSWRDGRRSPVAGRAGSPLRRHPAPLHGGARGAVAGRSPASCGAPRSPPAARNGREAIPGASIACMVNGLRTARG